MLRGVGDFQIFNLELFTLEIIDLQIPNFEVFKLEIIKLDVFHLYIFNFAISNFHIPIVCVVFRMSRISKFQISKTKCNFENTYTCQYFQNFRFSDMKIRFVKDVPIISCIC